MTDERRPAEQQEFQYWLPAHPGTNHVPFEYDADRLHRFEEHVRGIVALAIEDLKRELAQDTAEAEHSAAQLRRRLR